ncbi:hypothetical protein [Paracoccus jeotgali]|uniref:hypothetical protein n=1 Tax=Paracoccus jeotgali TaxID=2065379 RepID=UPI0028B048E7|nr:hypothetical protein [Paracoccus jeotgali]
MTTLTRLAAVLAATLWLAPVQAQTTDHLGLPGPITLAGDSFALAWSSRAADNYIKQEYLPAGETRTTTAAWSRSRPSPAASG